MNAVRVVRDKICLLFGYMQMWEFRILLDVVGGYQRDFEVRFSREKTR